MTQNLARREALFQVLVPENARGVIRQRLNKFAGWLAERGGAWHDPQLAQYADDLLNGYERPGKEPQAPLAPSTVQAYVSTVRSRYRALLRDPNIRAQLYEHAGAELIRAQQDDTPANRFAMVTELETRLRHALEVSVVVETQQDRVDADQLRLTKAQAESLMAQPGTRTVAGLRDTAILTLFLCTGIREGELVNLEVADLRQRVNGELGLHVRQGKGNKTRFVPYGDLSWVLVIVDKWLAVAGIRDGPVFRRVRRGGHVQAGPLTTRAVELILARYAVVVDGVRRTVRPHDLRRTYAARQYAAGMDLNAIRQNLGHADIQTTLGYIGDMDIGARRGQAVYEFDLAGLDGLGAAA